MPNQESGNDPRWQPRHWRTQSGPASAPAAGSSSAGVPAGAAPGAPAAGANLSAGPSGNQPAWESAWRTGLLEAQSGSATAASRPRVVVPAGDTSIALARPTWRSPAPPAPLVLAPGVEDPEASGAAPWTQGQPRRTRDFRPMDAILLGRSQNSNLTPEQREALGFSRHYQGDPLNPRNRSANIPENESTSLYIQHLPPGLTEKKLLDELQRHGPFGRVSQTWVRPHDPNRGHNFSAAKLVMFERPEAERVFNFVKNGGLMFDGVEAIIRWNTQRVQARSATPDAKNWYMTRSLRIWGPKELVDVKVLYEHWNSKIQFTTQDVFLLDETKNNRDLVWVFGSMRHQSELAFLALKEWTRQDSEQPSAESKEGTGQPLVEFRYASDPMEEAPGYTSAFRSLVHLVPALDNFNRAPHPPDTAGEQAGPGPAPALGQTQGRPCVVYGQQPVLPPQPSQTTQQPPPTQPAPTFGIPIRPALPAPPVPPTGPALPAPCPPPTGLAMPTQHPPLTGPALPGYFQGPQAQLGRRLAPIPNFPPGRGPFDPRPVRQAPGAQYPTGPGPAMQQQQRPQQAVAIQQQQQPRPEPGPAMQQQPRPQQASAYQQQQRSQPGPTMQQQPQPQLAPAMQYQQQQQPQFRPAPGLQHPTGAALVMQQQQRPQQAPTYQQQPGHQPPPAIAISGQGPAFQQTPRPEQAPAIAISSSGPAMQQQQQQRLQPPPQPVSDQPPAMNKQAEEEELRLGLRGPDSLPRRPIPPRSPYPNSEEEEEYYRAQQAQKQSQDNNGSGQFW